MVPSIRSLIGCCRGEHKHSDPVSSSREKMTFVQWPTTHLRYISIGID